MTMSPLPYQSPFSPQRDLDQLNVLAILSYIWGGIVMLFSCIGLIYMFIGLAVATGGQAILPTPGPNAPPSPSPAMFGWIFVTIGAAIVLLGWTIGGLNIYSARCMQTRKHRVFSLVMAGINCINFPFGTAMGVFTFIVLLRESVAQLYAENR